MRMWRTAKWKLVRDFLNPERDELYNLVKDPGETTNLIKSNDTATKKIIADLHRKIVTQMRKVNDPVLKTINSAE